jgi:copper(I)-binding protein
MISAGTRSLRAPFRAGAILLFVLGVIGFARADIESEVMNGVVVNRASALPAPQGGATRLRFSIENSSGRNLVLVGINSASAEAGRLLMDEGGSLQLPLDQLLIPDQEAIDLRTSHITAEFSGLRRAIRSGDTLEFELLFRTGRVAASADVHSEESGAR